MLQRLRSLQNKHSILEAKITREHLSVMPDDLRLQALKKLRLRCREEISRLESLTLNRTASAKV